MKFIRSMTKNWRNSQIILNQSLQQEGIGDHAILEFGFGDRLYWEYNSNRCNSDEVFNVLEGLKPKRSMRPDQIPPIYLQSLQIISSNPTYAYHKLSHKISYKSTSLDKILSDSLPKIRVNQTISNHRLSRFHQFQPKKLYSQTSTKTALLRGRSTQINLVELHYYVSHTLDRNPGNQVDVINTDFQKAFDKVSHSRLLAKLKDFSSSAELLSLFASYLTLKNSMYRTEESVLVLTSVRRRFVRVPILVRFSS